MNSEKIRDVRYLYAKGVENENTDFITGEIQNKLSQFAKTFNEQGGTLYISVVDRGRFRCNWDNIDKELSDKMIEHLSKYYVPGGY